jgi:hypothetical protein
MEKRKIVFLLLLAFGVVVVISFKGPSKSVSIKDQIVTPSKEKRILPEKIPQMPIIEVPPPSGRLKPIPDHRLSESSSDNKTVTEKEIVLGLENLKVIKDLEGDEKKVADGSPDIYLETPLTKTDSAAGDSVTIYKKGRVKIKGNAELGEFSEGPKSFEEIRDNLSVEGNLAVDF